MDEEGYRTFEAMQEKVPYKTYMKTVLGKVFVTVLNPFSGKPEGIILEGNPNDENDTKKCVVSTWNLREDLFFQKINETHFRSGNLKELPVPEKEKAVAVPKRGINEISDVEIAEILNKPFLALKNKINKFDSVAPIYRILKMAEEMEKSEKITNALKARISEIEFGVKAGED